MSCSKTIYLMQNKSVNICPVLDLLTSFINDDDGGGDDDDTVHVDDYDDNATIFNFASSDFLISVEHDIKLSHWYLHILIMQSEQVSCVMKLSIYFQTSFKKNILIRNKKKHHYSLSGLRICELYVNRYDLLATEGIEC